MKNIFLLILMPVLFSSCEKAINLDLGNVEEKYVIEGSITNEAGPSTVLISKTKNFDDNNQFNGVKDALVKIEYNNMVVILPETSKKGVYSTTAITGTPGQTYKLTVTVDGHVFTSSSTMPEPVALDAFYLKPNGFDTLKTVTFVKYKDPANVKNYYWFDLFINDKRQRNYDVTNDDFTPGQEVTRSIAFTNITDDLSKNLKKGDKLGIEMHSIDPSVYLYLFSLPGAEGSNNSAAPANPISNITGGALGFFSAHTTQRRTLVIP